MIKIRFALLALGLVIAVPVYAADNSMDAHGGDAAARKLDRQKHHADKPAVKSKKKAATESKKKKVIRFKPGKELQQKL